MDDLNGAAPAAAEGDHSPLPSATPAATDAVVSTHVLVSEAQAAKLRELSRKTRIAQSEYLREAVDDLLGKYGKPRPDEG